MAHVVVPVPDSLESAFARAVPTLVRALACVSGETPATKRQAARRKYDPIPLLLAARSEEHEAEVVVVSLVELDALVAGGLARSAWALASWWAPSQPQARAWSEAGWVARPLLAEGVVVFRRAQGEGVAAASTP